MHLVEQSGSGGFWFLIIDCAYYMNTVSLIKRETKSERKCALAAKQPQQQISGSFLLNTHRQIYSKKIYERVSNNSENLETLPVSMLERVRLNQSTAGAVKVGGGGD